MSHSVWRGTGRVLENLLALRWTVCRAHYVGSFTASKWTEYAVKLSRRRWQGGTKPGFLLRKLVKMYVKPNFLKLLCVVLKALQNIPPEIRTKVQKKISTV
jgi:hypothetical protein